MKIVIGVATYEWWPWLDFRNDKDGSIFPTVEISPDDFYTSLIYENLAEMGQDLMTDLCPDDMA